MSSLVSQRHSLMFRPRSYMAFAITPRPPIVDWLSNLDTSLQRSEAFFAGQHVALDLSAVNLSPSAIAQLVANLEERNIRVLGMKGLIRPNGRRDFLLSFGAAAAREPPSRRVYRRRPSSRARPPASESPQPASLMIENPVRSGQSVIFTEGDVTVLGSVGSGAEIVAGGSIHVYGTLRGRALAGATGNARARIFCHRIEAELLAINSYYRTADDIEDSLRRRPAQAWLARRSARFNTQSRFEKYGDRLFTFLNYDGVPWNNNNAEPAVHLFAKLRRISDGTFTRSSIEQLLVLLSVLGTCEYRRVNPLKFLLSGRREFRELENLSAELG